MKIIRNNIIPFPGFAAINLFGVLFVRKKTTISQSLLSHESIHTAQMKELWYVGFYVLYLCYWLHRVITLPKGYNAYRSIPFEAEAYCCQNNGLYKIGFRPRHQWKEYRDHAYNSSLRRYEDARHLRK